MQDSVACAASTRFKILFSFAVCTSAYQKTLTSYKLSFKSIFLAELYLFCKPAWHSSLQVTAGSFATAGRRGEDRMEDRHILVSPVADAEPASHLFAVFDGHRGAEAAHFAAAALEDRLRDSWARPSGEAALQVLPSLLQLLLQAACGAAIKMPGH